MKQKNILLIGGDRVFVTALALELVSVGHVVSIGTDIPEIEKIILSEQIDFVMMLNDKSVISYGWLTKWGSTEKSLSEVVDKVTALTE